ncbi:uncharacterized protein LOC143191361 isoform X2 [Rhynchophorus ferrugineus]
MVSHKNQKKAKKPLETSLGKASTKSTEDDLSHLRKPIATSITGIKQLLSLLETATIEVKNFLLFECDIMYECRTCRSIFRSLANFILHKRNYCREGFNQASDKTIDNYNETIENAKELLPETTKKAEPSRPLDRIIEKLHQKDQLNAKVSHIFTADLTHDVDNGRIKSMDEREEQSSGSNKIILEAIDTNKSGMFQTVLRDSPSKVECRKGNCMKSEVMEIHKILQNDVPVLDSEGKVCGFTNSKTEKSSTYPKSDISCSKCKQKFATQKSLTNHIKSVHNPSRIVYVCPTCKDTFANPWCVYRHLLRIHRMSNKQVRRLRDQIHNNGIRRDQESLLQKKKSTEQAQENISSENQWINDIEEDNAFQMCAGCGKRFERKAALHSHSQMCAKRLEVCNSIKENAKKKEEEEAAIEKAKQEKPIKDKPAVKGASKRKCKSTFNRKLKDPPQVTEESGNVIEEKSEETVEIKIEQLQTIESGQCDGSVVEEIITIKMEKDDSNISGLQMDQNIIVNKESDLVENEFKNSGAEEKNNDQLQEEISSSVVQEEKQTYKKIEKTNDYCCDNATEIPLDRHELIQSPKNIVYTDINIEDICNNAENITQQDVEDTNDEPASGEISNDDVIFIGVESIEEQRRTTKKRKSSGDNGGQSDVNDDNFLLMATPYMDQENLTCMPCVANFRTLKLLLWHMSAHFSWFRYQCAKCSFVTFNKYDCLSHLRREHKVIENTASTFILPLPNWKTLLMSHDFRVLKDSNSFGGKHTDEDITVEDVQLVEPTSQQMADLPEPDSSLFGELGKLTTEENFKDISEKENVKRGRWERHGIDLQDYKVDDPQKLPEPLELCMPADVSDVIRTLEAEEPLKSPDQPAPFFDICDESNDDWLLYKDDDDKDDDDRKVNAPQRPPSPKSMFTNLRPSRIRTKTKMNDDFVYYD